MGITLPLDLLFLVLTWDPWGLLWPSASHPLSQQWFNVNRCISQQSSDENWRIPLTLFILWTKPGWWEVVEFAAGPPTPHWEPWQETELPSSSRIPLFCSNPHQFAFEFPVWSLCLMGRQLSRHLFLKRKKVSLYPAVWERLEHKCRWVNTGQMRLIWNQ